MKEISLYMKDIKRADDDEENEVEWFDENIIEENLGMGRR